MDILRFSGKDEVGVSISRQEEELLQLHAVFCDAPSATQLRAMLDGTKHCGVHGPTKSGQYVIKTRQAELGEIRQKVLGPLSRFAGQWDLVPSLRFEGLFPSSVPMDTIARSLAVAWKWRCVAIQARKQGKRFHLVTLGADADPPHREVAFKGEIVVLKKLEPKAEGVVSAFTPPIAAAGGGDVEMVSPAPTLPDLVLEKCSKTLEAMSQQVREQSTRVEKQLGGEVEKRYLDAEKGLSSQVQKVQNDQAQHRQEVASLIADLEKKIESSRTEAREADGKLEGAMEALKQDTTSSFAKVRESLDAQTQLIHKSQSETQEQLRVFGKQIMEQLSSLESEKRRKSEERGGMISSGASTRESSTSSSSSSSSSSSDVLIEREETREAPIAAGAVGNEDRLGHDGGSPGLAE